MKYGFVLSLTLGVTVSLSSVPAIAMEDLRSYAQVGTQIDLDAIEGDFLDGAFGLDAIASDADLGETRGRQSIHITSQNTENRATNRNNVSLGDTGNSNVGGFDNSTLGQAVSVSGNNNNVQVSTTVNINLF